MEPFTNTQVQGTKRNLFASENAPKHADTGSNDPTSERVRRALSDSLRKTEATPARSKRWKAQVRKPSLPTLELSNGRLELSNKQHIRLQWLAKGEIHNVWELLDADSIGRLERGSPRACGLFYRWMQAGCPQVLMKTHLGDLGHKDRLSFAARTQRGLQRYDTAQFLKKRIRVAKHFTQIHETGFALVERICAGQIDRTNVAKGSAMEHVRSMLESMVLDPVSDRIDDATPDNILQTISARTQKRWLVLIDPDYSGDLDPEDAFDRQELAIKYERLFILWAGAELSNNNAFDLSALKTDILRYLMANLRGNQSPLWLELEARLNKYLV